MTEWPGIAVPAWNQRPSGLWLPADVEIVQHAQLPPELAGSVARGILVAGQPPGWRDQVAAYLTVEEIGFPKPSESQVVGAIRKLPFDATVLALAHLQYELWPHRADLSFQKQLLDRVIPVSDSPFRRNVYARLDREEHMLIFSEQGLFAMQRLVMLFSRQDEAAATIEDDARFAATLFSVPAVFLNPDEELESEVLLGPGAEERWIRYFIAHGGLFPSEWFGASVARAHQLYSVLAGDETSQAHHQYCPVDEWLLEASGLSIAGLQALGIGLSVGAGVFDDQVPAPRPVPPGFFETTALSDNPSALTTLAADRDWFMAEIGKTQADARHVARNFLPFFQHPALLRRDGSQLLLSPRALQEAIGDHGLYFRLLDLSRARGHRQRFSNFNGWLYERYALERAESAFATQTTDGVSAVVSVVGEHPYVVSGQTLMTPDIAISCSFDLVLVEVTSSHLTTQSLIEGDADKVRADLSKTLVEKIVQLAHRIADLRSGAAAIPGVDMRQVERIWPVVVYADALFLSKLLWDYTTPTEAESLINRASSR